MQNEDDEDEYNATKITATKGSERNNVSELYTDDETTLCCYSKCRDRKPLATATCSVCNKACHANFWCQKVEDGISRCTDCASEEKKQTKKIIQVYGKHLNTQVSIYLCHVMISSTSKLIQLSNQLVKRYVVSKYTKQSCTYFHSQPSSYYEEGDPKRCGTKNYLNGVKCCSCEKTFVTVISKKPKEKKKQLKPSSTKPAHVCLSHKLWSTKGSWCMQALCDDCWKKSIVDTTGEELEGKWQ